MNPRAVCFALAGLGLAAEAPLPLPDAPVRLVIPDAAAFDASLGGEFRRFLEGSPRDGEMVTTAFRRSRVGSKLEDQWQRLSADLPWTWGEIAQLKPRSVGLAILQVGHLEAVLAVDTPLAQLPHPLPPGTARTHGGVAYALVTRGAADGSKDKDRRMGLAWARLGSRLLVATSERALLLALDAAQAGRGLASPLPGLVAMELDLDALRKDRYFKREFLWPAGTEQGRMKVALRKEGKGYVEVRSGSGERQGGAWRFQAPGAAAEGWEPDGSGFWAAFRRGLLEPLVDLPAQPVPALRPLPEPPGAGDRYDQDLTKPLGSAAGPGEEGDLAGWRDLLAKHPVPAWGFWVAGDGTRRLAFPWPEAQTQAFLEQCRATAARRAGRASLVRAGDTWEVRIGPALPALAVRRAGPLLWAGPSAQSLAELPAASVETGLVRWARLDLDAVRGEQARWAKAEGPAGPERVRPLSDQVLGLLGWMPGVRAISVERRSQGGAWEERVTFSGRP